MVTGLNQNFGSRTDLASGLDLQTAQSQETEAERIKRLKAECEAGGGYWDAEKNQCLLVRPKEEQPTADLPTANLKTGEITQPTGGQYDPKRGGFVTEAGDFYPTTNPDFKPGQTDQKVEFLPNGNVVYQGQELTKEEYAAFQGKGGAITSNVQAAQALTPEAMRLQQAQQQAAQVGQFGQLGLENDPLFNYQQAVSQGLLSSVPRTLGIIGTAVAGGAAAGATIAGVPTLGAGAPIGALIGGAIGFIGGISGAIISEMKGQRTDTVNAQKRVLDEGKQNMNDWVTLASQDPANRQQYIAQFNRQLALIDQAYRQMKADTSRDLAKFETALPDLAEFQAFYSVGGERDALIQDMQQSLLLANQNVDFKMLELMQRRGSLQ